MCQWWWTSFCLPFCQQVDNMKTICSLITSLKNSKRTDCFVTAVGGVVVRLNEKAEEKQKPFGGISKGKEMLLSTSLLKWWVSQQFDRSSSVSLHVLTKCQSGWLEEVQQIDQQVILQPSRHDSGNTDWYKLKFEVLATWLCSNAKVKIGWSVCCVSTWRRLRTWMKP